jgi:hypothetical protein
MRKSPAAAGDWTQRRIESAPGRRSWAHYLNVFMLDRDGNRIDRRNPQDIFTRYTITKSRLVPPLSSISALPFLKMPRQRSRSKSK